MDQSPVVTAPVSVTTETLVLSRTTIRFGAAAVPFVARVRRVPTRRGKDYSILRMTIPKEIGEKIGIGDKEFLFMLAQKAEWFHMIDWTRMPETFAKLPPEVRGILEASGLIPTVHASGSTGLTGSSSRHPQFPQLSEGSQLGVHGSPTTA